LPHIGPDAVKIGSPDGVTLSIFVVRGTSALAQRETGEQPMNATIRTEQLESIEADSDLAAV
jgi:hypothetical protein